MLNSQNIKPKFHTVSFLSNFSAEKKFNIEFASAFMTYFCENLIYLAPKVH
jgi:hypothetical protein